MEVLGALAMAALVSPASPVQSFPASAVRLRPGPFQERQEANGRYLLSLEPGRLLHGFYETAGLPTRGARYGGWESMGVAGHTLGHYLTAASYQYAATGDRRFRDRVAEIVADLAKCQERRPDGYIGAIPDGDRVWAEIRRGEIRSAGFDLNGLWVPWYTQHKVFAGLIDAYRIAEVPEALPIAVRLGEWALDVTKNLTPEQWQKMLACEHGGMNESLAELYAITKDRRFLELARKFHHDAVLNPLKAREDRLAGLHSNTQIPKVIGLARLYELEAKPEDRTAAEFFWDRIVRHRTYAMGGNSDHEHLAAPDRLSDFLSTNSAETCNTYNMLKLTRHLYAWEPKAERFDFYERALLNHILASQRPADGMMTYYVPLQPHATRPFSTPFDSFWCCVGTGIENHARYNEAIFAHTADELRVNLFVPSDLWTESYDVRLEADLPESDKVRLTLRRSLKPPTALAIRRPAWLAKNPTFRVNGREVRAKAFADGYLRITRDWKAGDTLEWTLPMALRTEPMPDNPDRIAIIYGPFVLAAVHPGEAEEMPPVFVPGRRSVGSWLRRVPGKELRFRSAGVLRPRDLEFVPFYRLSEGRYTTYFDRYSASAWRAREAEIRKEAERLAAEERATVDVFRPGEMQPERDHNFQGERTETGEHLGRKWRHAVDGWFSFDLAVDPAVANTLVLTYWGGDGGREFSILVEGQELAAVKMANTSPPRFFQARHALPIELTRGKSKVTIRFVAKPGSVAGGLFGARTVRTSPNP